MSDDYCHCWDSCPCDAKFAKLRLELSRSKSCNEKLGDRLDKFIEIGSRLIRCVLSGIQPDDTVDAINEWWELVDKEQGKK